MTQEKIKFEIKHFLYQNTLSKEWKQISQFHLMGENVLKPCILSLINIRTHRNSENSIITKYLIMSKNFSIYLFKEDT